MKIHNEITVAAPPDELFGFLSDVERVAPCLPGAAIEGRDGEDYLGRMKVKVGPINATYAGKLRFVELDEDGRRAVMRARADEVNGQGAAEAHITTAVEGDGDESTIRMDTDLQIRGKVAQFGRGAMEKISQRMFEEFARNIEQAVAGNGAAPADEADEPAEDDAPAGDDAPARRAGGTRALRTARRSTSSPPSAARRSRRPRRSSASRCSRSPTASCSAGCARRARSTGGWSASCDPRSARPARPRRRALRRRAGGPRPRPRVGRRAGAPGHRRPRTRAPTGRARSPPSSGSSGCSACTSTATGARGRATSSTGSPASSSRRPTPGLRTFVSVQGSLAMTAIDAWGSEEHKRQWLPRMARGEAVGCFALTEPDTGSDPASMSTVARRDGGDWVLDGAQALDRDGIDRRRRGRVGEGRRRRPRRGFLVPAGRRASRRRTSRTSSRCGRRCSPS